MASNVVPLFGKRPQAEAIPENISGPTMAVMNWAESNGIDIYNDVRFQIRLADFMALLQTTIAEKQCA